MTIPSASVPFPGATPRPVGFYWIRTYGQVQHETVYGDVVSRWTGTEWESPWPVLDLEPIPAMGELRALRTERDALKDEVQRLREECIDTQRLYATVSDDAANLQEKARRLEASITAATSALEEIVCTVGEDTGVVMLSDDGPTDWNEEHQCHVYRHQFFSPLGDALIALHTQLTAALRVP